MEVRGVDFSEGHDYYETNRIEISRAFAKKYSHNEEWFKDWFTPERATEAFDFLKGYYISQGIELSCGKYESLAHMLLVSVKMLERKGEL